MLPRGALPQALARGLRAEACSLESVLSGALQAFTACQQCGWALLHARALLSSGVWYCACSGIVRVRSALQGRGGLHVTPYHPM